MIFFTPVDLEPGTILIPGKTVVNGWPFSGLRDWDGNLHNTAVKIVRKATKEEFFKQFEEFGMEMKLGTKWAIENENPNFYEVEMD